MFLQLKQLLKISYLKHIFSRCKTVFLNNPLLFYLVLLLIFIFFSNIIIINIKKKPARYNEFITFKKFETLEKKYRYQEVLFSSLKKLDYADFKIHTVKLGENYWGIAGFYSTNNQNPTNAQQIGIDTIIGLNPYLKNYYASENEKLIVCNRRGCLHIIQKNESIYSIAGLYNKPVKLIRKANNRNIIKDIILPLKEGDVLFIPGARPKILTEEMQEFYKYRDIMASPITGKYTSAFGWRKHPVHKKWKRHYGLDIRARVGQRVYASLSGVVTHTGWAKGYGKMIKIEHYNGYATAYGHLSRIYVRKGKKVNKGEIIGRAGNTGISTGPHLDFRVWYKGKLKDPALYLW